MTASTFIPASTKQLEFLSDLLATRECDTDFRDTCLDLSHTDKMSKQLASVAIDLLINAPRIKNAKSTSPLQDFFAGVPKSKYAVPVSELEFGEYEDTFKTDLVFVELKEYRGTLYARRLIGAPGAFTRTKMTIGETKALFGIITQDPHKYARIFGEHYACCGSCGAELTDARSRELQLGPECRKKFGL